MGSAQMQKGVSKLNLGLRGFGFGEEGCTVWGFSRSYAFLYFSMILPTSANIPLDKVSLSVGSSEKLRH